MVHVIDRRRAWALDSPGGCDLRCTLVLTPNTAAGLQDWDASRDAQTSHMLDIVTALATAPRGDPEIRLHGAGRFDPGPSPVGVAMVGTRP